MTMCYTSHPKDYIDRLYVSRKGGRRFVSIEHGDDTAIRHLEDYKKKYQSKID